MEQKQRSHPSHGGSARAAERTLDILLAFLPDGHPLGISELSRAVHLPKGTVHRLVSVLVGRGFLARDPVTAQYRIGLATFRLGNLVLAQAHVRAAALPVIRALASATGETVNLNVVIDGRRVCIEKAESSQDIRHAVELGRPMPLYAGASGKVLLAHLPEAEINPIVAAGLRRLTESPPVERHRLLRQLAEIRRRGVAVSSNERIDGASSVSAPIRDGIGRVVAGLTISGPTYRFTPRRVREFIALVRDGARRVSGALGYRPEARDGEAPFRPMRRGRTAQTRVRVTAGSRSGLSGRRGR